MEFWTAYRIKPEVWQMQLAEAAWRCFWLAKSCSYSFGNMCKFMFCMVLFPTWRKLVGNEFITKHSFCVREFVTWCPQYSEGVQYIVNWTGAFNLSWSVGMDLFAELVTTAMCSCRSINQHEIHIQLVTVSGNLKIMSFGTLRRADW
jgi:hypothetical protein